jgi:hypothetical protein
MDNQMKTTRDYQLKPVRVVILKQSPDGQPFWPIPDPLPPAIDAYRESYTLFRLPRQYDISCGDLPVKSPSLISDSYGVYYAGLSAIDAYCKSSITPSVFRLLGQYDIACGDLLVSDPNWISYSRDKICYPGLNCHLVEHVSIENDSSFVIAKSLYDAIILPNCICLDNLASLTKIPHSSRLRLAILKQSRGRSFWPISDSLPLRDDVRLVWESKPYYLFVFPGQHDILCGDLLTDCHSRYYFVRQVSFDYLVFAELIDVVKFPDRVYFNNFLHEPEPIDDLVEFVASLTIGDVFADHWPPEHERANIYIFRDADVIFYVGSSPRGKVYNRVRAHIKTRSGGHSDLHDLVKNNMPDSLNWNIDLYRAKKTYISDLLGESASIIGIESNIIRRLHPVINQQFNPCPTPLPIRYEEWRWR